MILCFNVFTTIVEDKILTKHHSRLVVDLETECGWFFSMKLCQ
jgi:hypothetical protein